MKKIFLFLTLALNFLLFSDCYPKDYDLLTQVSTIDTLLAGSYDGVLPLDSLTDRGDLGIGTFDKLDGEMILLDGKLFQVTSSGKVKQLPLNTLTPFAVVVNFFTDQKFLITEPIAFANFESYINNQLTNKNVFYAIKIKGVFPYMKTRSVPAQEKPYPILAEVVKKQAVFEMKNVSGTLIGFYTPVFLKGINVPGYHWHFISDDLQKGGHVLDFQLQSGNAEIGKYDKFYLRLPDDQNDFAKVDLSIDREKELQKVEK